MSARIFVHPRCAQQNVAQGAMIAEMDRVGFPTNNMRLLEHRAGVYEIVELAETTQTHHHYKRCDGAIEKHLIYGAGPPPGRAA